MVAISEYPNMVVPHRKRIHVRGAQEPKNIPPPNPPSEPPPDPHPEPPPEPSPNSRKRTTPEPDASSDVHGGLPPPPPPPPPPPTTTPKIPSPPSQASESAADDLFDALSPLNEQMRLSPEPIPLATIMPDSDQPMLPSDNPYPEGIVKDFRSLLNNFASDVSVAVSYDYPSPDAALDYPPTSPDDDDYDDDEGGGFTIRRTNLDSSRRRRISSMIVDSSSPVDHAFQPHPLSTSPSSKMVGAGVANLGNTCFMNAILQCFTHTVPLLQGLRSCTHNSPCEAVGFCVICAFREHFDASLEPCRITVLPTTLVDNLSYLLSSFTRYQQEDAHEFMLCALNKLRRCFPSGENNLVEKIFGGRLISKLRCCSCGHSSNTYEPVIDLSLEIENVCTLQHALESFTKVEKMDEKFTCGGCNQEVSKEKQLMLDQTPLVAAFHLKRFQREGSSVKKIDTHVHFTTEVDLEPYTSGNGSHNNAHLKYDLYAVVEHTGYTPNSGHYFCFIRSAPDKWHRMDDSQVTSVSEEVVLSHEAYILFYARQGTPWFSSIAEGEGSVSKPISDNKKIDFGPFGFEQKRDIGPPPGFEQNDNASTDATDMCVSDMEEEECNSANTSAP